VTPTARRQWPSFVSQVHARLEAGARAYGDKSFAASPEALVLEVQQELEDVCGWAFVLWARLEAIREALEGAGAGQRDSITSTPPATIRSTAPTPSATRQPDTRGHSPGSVPDPRPTMGPGSTSGSSGSGATGSGSTSAANRYGTPEAYAEGNDES
jgi:hypothetical protein